MPLKPVLYRSIGITSYEEIVGVDAQLNSMGNALAWEEEELNKFN